MPGHSLEGIPRTSAIHKAYAALFDYLRRGDHCGSMTRQDSDRLIELIEAAGGGLDQRLDGGSPVSVTALNAAIRRKRYRLAIYLLSRGASATARDSTGVAPIIALAGYRPNYLGSSNDPVPDLTLQLFDRLIVGGADMNAVDSMGEHALLTACQSGFDELVRAMINKGADPHVANRLFGNAYAYALGAIAGTLNVMAMGTGNVYENAQSIRNILVALSDAGVDPGYRNAMGEDAAMVAKRRADETLASVQNMGFKRPPEQDEAIQMCLATFCAISARATLARVAAGARPG